MKQERFLTKLACMLFLPVLAATSLLARDEKDSVWISRKETIRVVHENAPFDILKSTLFFNRRCLTTIDCLNFPLAGAEPILSLAPEHDSRNMEEKIADEFAGLTTYPGGTFLYNTVLAGLDLMQYSRRKTSFTYQNFRFGSNLGGAGRGFLKTGVFYDF